MTGQVITEPAAATGAVPSDLTLVEATSTQIVGANASREKLVIACGVADIWLGYGVAAVQGKGVVVRSAGDAFEVTGWKGSVYAISAGAATVGWMETSYNVGEDEGQEPTGTAAFVPSGPSDGHPATDTPAGPIFGLGGMPTGQGRAT